MQWILVGIAVADRTGLGNPITTACLALREAGRLDSIVNLFLRQLGDLAQYVRRDLPVDLALEDVHSFGDFE